jgi:NTP pyrophosphatase (non-canonical NTP hydrolase)
MVKLQEECGEFAVAVLKKEGWKGMGKDTATTNHDNILEEGCDVMIIVMSVLAKYKFTEEQIDEKLQQKLDKWKNLINKK